ncbi:uncharacterized protein LOC126184460 [Schistocerca cancellata]|uniref:uncharacterized protein LOC126184460 n=1 Tax=Schistocerca cancellata TaxID=274614 RepID=UPI00211864F7|nr:uncharacterized protein LOC126184460 [Schistocerca cancellata]
MTYLYWEDIHRSYKTLQKLRTKKGKLLSRSAFLLRCRDKEVMPTFAKLRHPVNTNRARHILRQANAALVREHVRATRLELDTNARSLLSLHFRLAACPLEHTCDWIEGNTFTNGEWSKKKATERQCKKFLRLPKVRQQKEKPSLNKVVINLTSKKLDGPTQEVLSKGLNLAPVPRTLPKRDIISGVEEAIKRLPDEAAEEVRRDVCKVLDKAKMPKNNISAAEHKALRALREDQDTVVLAADKGNATVLLKSEDYWQKNRRPPAGSCLQTTREGPHHNSDSQDR